MLDMVMQVAEEEFDSFADRLTGLLAEHWSPLPLESTPTDIEPSTITELCGARSEYNHSISNLADYFGVSVEWLARGKGPKYRK